MNYFDDPAVRTALHIDSTFTDGWEMCTTNPDWNYTVEPQASQWIYEELHGKMRMMVYSGNVDGSVGTIGTQNWIDSLNWEIVEDWATWKYFNNSTQDEQVAGFRTTYVDDFEFIIINGAGHMVPEDKPL